MMLSLWIVSAVVVSAVELYAWATLWTLHRAGRSSEAGKWVLGGIFAVFGLLAFFLAGRCVSLVAGADPLRIGRWLAAIGGESVAMLAVVSLSLLVARVVHYVSTQEGDDHGAGARA